MRPVRVFAAFVMLLSPGAATRSLAEPTIPLFLDDFECSSTVRWSQTQGGAPIVLPPAGVFEPVVQCEWNSAPIDDPYLGHLNVLPTPLFAELPYGAPGSVEIVAMAYNATDGGLPTCQGTDPASYGVLRILDGSTCALLDTVADASHPMIAAAPPALGDLDGDGFVDLVALENGGEIVAFRWSSKASGYEFYWSATDTDLAAKCRWDGASLHDLDDDGFPEVISGQQVYDGRTGSRLDDGSQLPANNLGLPVVADVDGDGAVELAGEALFEWDDTLGQWTLEATTGDAGSSTALADFDADSVPEIARGNGGSSADVRQLDGTVAFAATTFGGGPPAIADFDADGSPEVALGEGSVLSMLDSDCAGTPSGCVADNVRWRSTIQDLSSRRSMAAAFDFDVDGESEVVFADECFLRVFDGSDGEVLASVARTSCTWLEGPTVGDVDGDGSAEIVVGSNANCSISCPALDPIDRGLRCASGTDCGSGSCDAGYCRCESDVECPATGYSCATPLAETPGTGAVCRASHGGALQGIRVIADAGDRWGPARAIWNQAAYDVFNVEDDGGIPATGHRIPGFQVPFRNDFRAQDSLCAPKP